MFKKNPKKQGRTNPCLAFCFGHSKTHLKYEMLSVLPVLVYNTSSQQIAVAVLVSEDSGYESRTLIMLRKTI